MQLYKLMFVLFFLLASQTQTNGQGTLFSKEEANQKFGPVINQIELPVNIILNFTNQATNTLMFKIINNQSVILDDGRNILYPAGAYISENDVFTAFNVAIIRELLNKGNDNIIRIEQRKDVLSITFGQTTMEVGTLCPPYCP